MNRTIPWAVAGAVAASTFLAAPEASAQDVSPTGKGIAGGAMLGAEVVVITTGLIGVKSWWPYVVFGAVGAGGGAVGGYFVEQAGPAEPSLFMLAGGMALIIPTVVVALNATAYDPTEDEEGFDEGVEPGEGDESIEGEVTTGRRAPLPMAILGVDAWGEDTSVSLGIPAVSVAPSFTPVEVAKYGVSQQTQVSVPLVEGRF